jgi:hypothetical protein
LGYLSSVGAFPNPELIKLDDKQLTGPFISSVILTHIDFDNDINANKQFQSGSIDTSISFDFDPNTFKQLFHIIEQLTIKQDLTSIDIHIRTVLLKLLTTHLKFLCAIKQDLPTTTINIKPNKDIDSLTFLTDDDLQKWFDILSRLAFDQTQISKEALKAFMYLLHQKFSSFIDKLSFYHKTLTENQSPILVKEFFIEFNKNLTLFNWIELLCNNNQSAFTILYSFIDIILNPSNDFNEEYIKQIEQILKSFRQFLFIRLIPKVRLNKLLNGPNDDPDVEPITPLSTSSVVVKLFTYILTKSISKTPIRKDLFNLILGDLYLMTDTEKLFHFATIQPIFINILPLLADYILQNLNKDGILNDLYWLIGKMINILIIGSPQDSLEIKYSDKLKLSLFAGGCEKMIIEKNEPISNLLESNLASYSQFKWAHQNDQSPDDDEFLMSIYNNLNQGAQLILKMKTFIKTKQYLLQKSIEQQADDACAAVFAVYIKYFRRINLAKYELIRTNNKKPQKKLFSIFEYANYVYILFATTKGQGGDCNQLYNQIKINTLFLLSSIKESHLIPIIEIDTNLSETNQRSEKKSSRWRKERHPFRVVRNVFKASNRFKKMMLANQQLIQQKQDNEYLLHQIIDEFIYKTIILSTNENKNFQSEDIIQCMHRQYQRALTRLITYRFISTFIQKILPVREQVMTMVSICLPYLRGIHLEWTYLENIQTANDDLKEEIGHSYYSIMKTILSLQSESTLSIKTLFHLLNFSYKQSDIHRLYDHQFVEILFKTFVSFVEKPTDTVSLYIKFLGYNWFRLYLLKLSENIQIEKEQGEFIFNKLILNELKQLKQIPNDINIQNNSLKNTAIAWFIQPTKDTKLCLNQLLMLLLRCLNSYTDVRHYCATVDYIEELLYIYRNSQNKITTLLSLKILRNLIPLLPEDINEPSKIMMKNLFHEILSSIGESLTSDKMSSEITTELIYIYRTIMSVTSSWQIIATQLIFDTILSNSNLKSLETMEMNNLLSSLCILGGYIYPYCLTSIVQVYSDDQINNETQLAVIIDIDQNALDSNSIDALPYLIQYSQSNKTQQVNANKLRIEIDVPPPNLLILPNINETLSTLFDVLISFIELDTSESSLLLLQLKRRSIGALYRLLNNKKLIDIFLQKPYASIIAKLSTLDLLSTTNRQPIDLQLSNKQHLEQYSLSLDRCEQSKQMIHEKNLNNKDLFIHWNDQLINQDHLTIDLLSTALSQDCQWKSNVSKKDIQLLKRGRIGNDQINIVPMPPTITNTFFFEESGVKHRFPGRTYLISESGDVSIATFIIDNLRLSEGKWYYCVRLLEGANVQIGWATTGFTPTNTIGIGNDKYSWSYDGSQNKLYNNGEQYQYLTNDLHWGMNDVCGCGIEICDNRIRINYWLNGHCFGRAFEHQLPIGMTTTTTKCDMLPNGYGATYFPGITLKATNYSISSCEFIFNPEDMFECPLPKDYKPLVLPSLINIDQTFVPYPYSAYLIGDNIQDYIQTKRNVKTNAFLRDFVNDDHLENVFQFDNHQLILGKESNGFPLMIDHHGSLTISFDFEILTNSENSDIQLLTSDAFSIRIPSNKITQPTRIAIIFDSNTRQTTIYLNNDYQIIENSLTKYNLHILPNLSAGIKNIGLWKYALSQEHIRHLFAYGLFYVSLDYHRLKDHRKQANTLTFNKNEEHFSDELLIPFDRSAVQLFGNKTYLILDKTINSWEEYTLILDILITSLPKTNEQITLVTLNDSHLQIFITDHGHLSLSNGITSESVLKLNEDIRLLISVDKKSIKIYANGQSMINDKITDLTNNTIDENTLQIECKSITYWNKSTNIMDEKMKSSKYSFDSFIAPPFSIIAPSLLLIGYDQPSIKSVMERHITTNIQLIDTILREKTSTEEQPKDKDKILLKVTPLIDQEKLKHLINSSQFNTDESMNNLSEIIFIHRKDLQTSSIDSISQDENNSSDKKWFYQSVHHLDIQDSLTDWIRDKSIIANEVDLNYQLIDLNQPIQEQTILIGNQHKIIPKSIQYSHQQITDQQYCQSRIACEHELISIYAHYIILNMLRIWSNDASNLFPLELFGDYTFIITLFKLLDYHYTYTRLNIDENIDRMSLLTTSILKVEITELLKQHTATSNQITDEIFQQKAPLLYQLQKDFVNQWIRFLSNPSYKIFDHDDETTIINKQSIINQPNFKFILKLFYLFMKLLTDQSTKNPNEIDFLVSLLFPELFINLLFDLFLLSQSHQSKIFILHIFSNLIQTSQNFNLNKHIQNFLFQLFIEFPPNPTSRNSRMMKIFQISLMDIVYLLLERQNQTTEFDLTKFSSNFSDLVTTIDIINGLIDKTKPIPFPIKSNIAIDDKLKFTQDEIEKSNSYFDLIADQQLIRFMNNNPLIDSSIIELVHSLPNESEPNPTYYKIYPSLFHIPAIYIQTRAKLICQFNLFIENLISIIDFNLLPGQSILIDKIRLARSYILYPLKFQLLNTSIISTTVEPTSGMSTVNFDTVAASDSNNSAHTMFYQAYEQLHENAHALFRMPYDRLWLAQYIGMHSTDQGGPYRDSITRICLDICSTRLSLFILCPNGRMNSGLNRDRWIPNVFPPNRSIPNKIKKQYRFIGQLMGMAIRKKHYLDLKFPSLLWKQLVREPISLEDIESIDMQSFTMINEMEKNIKQIQSMGNNNDINDLFSSVMDELRFEIVSSAGQTYELIPGGKDIPITANNFKDYCNYYREYRLNEFKRQIEFIRQGLYNIIPGYFLSLFTPNELEEAVCGKGEIDVELLKRNTYYGEDCNANSPHIQRFWTVITDMLNEEQKKLFLIFVWGRCTLPSRDEDFTNKFTINSYDVPRNEVDGTLPSKFKVEYDEI